VLIASEYLTEAATRHACTTHPKLLPVMTIAPSAEPAVVKPTVLLMLTVVIWGAAYERMSGADELSSMPSMITDTIRP